MKAPWNFARFLPLAERLLSRGRLPALLFAVARKGPRLGQLREDVKLLQSLPQDAGARPAQAQEAQELLQRLLCADDLQEVLR